MEKIQQTESLKPQGLPTYGKRLQKFISYTERIHMTYKTSGTIKIARPRQLTLATWGCPGVLSSDVNFFEERSHGGTRTL
jgi:hypothetical protein